jgi:hypothetical protein
MENEYIAQNRLTTKADSPKLSGGDIFMADIGHVEGESVNPVEPTPPVVNAPGVEGESGNQQSQEATGGAANNGNGGERTSTQSTPEGGNGGGNRGRGRGRDPNEGRPPPDYADMYLNRKKEFWDVLHAFEPHVNSGGIPADLLKFIIELRDDDRPLMYMVNKIITLPLDNETARYSLGLSAQSIKEQITAALKQTLLEATGNGDAVAAEQTRIRRDRVVATIEAVELLHNMNKAIVTAGIKTFDALAEEITPEQQQVLQNVAGASQVMRLFEDEYQRILMDQKTITTENNDELMSRSGKSLGKHSEGEKDSDKDEAPSKEEARDESIGIVEGRLKELRDYAKANNVDEKSSLGKLSKLEDWELNWAFHAGKLLYNISLRAAEQISMGDVPGGGAALKSPPQENMVRIMNQINWIHKRFNKGEARGGVEFVNRAQAHFQELRERSGFGSTGLKRLAGKSIEDYEVASMFGVSGIFSGWRNEMIILDHSPIKINGEPTTILRYINAVKKAKEEALRGNRSIEEWNKVKDKTMTLNEPDILRSIFLQDGKLRPEFNNALGVLIRWSDIQGKGKDVGIKGLTDTKTDIRQAIWKKIAEDNPLAVAYFLNGMEFADGKAPFSGEKLKDFKAFADPKNGCLNTEKNPVWKSLREKLIMAREVRMSKIAKGKEEMSLAEALGTLVEKGSAEDKLLKQIQEYGKDVSRDLAAVRLPFNPFMTDVVFEQAEYAGAGNQYYRRRVGDIGAIHASYEALNKIVGDPAGLGREETMKALKEMMVAIDAPNGWEAAQDSVMPFFMSVLDFWEAGGQYTDKYGEGGGIKRWLAKDNLFRPIASKLMVADSLAQKYGGVKAIAYDEFAMREVINEALTIGISRKTFRDKNGILKMIDTDDWLKKKKGVKMRGWLMAFFRDLFLKALIPAMVIQVGKETKKSDKR